MSGMEPIIRPRPEHCISRRDIDPDALKVLYRLLRRGYMAYLVGGGVRDLLLGRSPKDFDVSTSATPQQIKRLFNNCFLIGRRFRLAHIKYGNNVIETSTFRRTPEAQGDGEEGTELLQTEDNTFGTPEEDALRRDFTINGLFYDVDTFSVIDYVGGLRDLDAKMIRAIGDPDIRFREDPVRMIRAVRFAGRLGFSIEESTYAALLRHCEEIDKASAPRVQEEIYRLFAFGAGEASMRLLYQTGLMRKILPTVAEYLDLAGSATRLWDYLREFDRIFRERNDQTPAMIMAALLYPVAEYQAEAGEATVGALAEKGLDLIGKKYCVARRLKDRFTRIFAAQSRFQPGRKRKMNVERFSRHDYFTEALLMYCIHLRALGEEGELLKEWLPYMSGPSCPAGEEDGEPEACDREGDVVPEVRTRRRRKRRRHKIDTTESARLFTGQKGQSVADYAERNATEAKTRGHETPSDEPYDIILPGDEADGDVPAPDGGEEQSVAERGEGSRKKRRRGGRRSKRKNGSEAAGEPVSDETAGDSAKPSSATPQGKRPAVPRAHGGDHDAPQPHWLDEI